MTGVGVERSVGVGVGRSVGRGGCRSDGSGREVARQGLGAPSVVTAQSATATETKWDAKDQVLRHKTHRSVLLDTIHATLFINQSRFKSWG